MKKIKCGTCGCITDVENPVPGVKCPNCGMELIGQNAKITDVCLFCGEPIKPHEAEIFCPGCGTEYHADCWIDHDGCGVSGCAYVDVLAPMEIPTESSVPKAPTTQKITKSSSEETIKAKPGEDFFEIKNAPKAPVSSRKNEEELIEERMEIIRKRTEMPEEKKISKADVIAWLNTPRDTKYDFDGPWFKDPYLFQKAKNYVIFLFGGMMGGAVLGGSLAVIMLMFKYMFFHTGLSYTSMCFFFFVGLICGMVSAVYMAYRTMATLIDN